MKISRDWLSDYVDLGTWSDDDVAKRLTEIGHAVESVEKHGEDTVFDVEFTTNRIDAMSHFGLARDLAAAFGSELKVPVIDPLPSSPAAVAVSIEAPELCTRFSGLTIKGVTIGPSSAKVQRRLEAVGLRPISNVVDATNYVMLAFGHPLHAYDESTIAGRSIVVRRAAEGEKVRSLDSIERVLDSGTTVIADAARAIGIGGIIGAENSEISPSTRDVFLECAHFDAASVRRSARRLGIKTDASYRFERGVDPTDGPRSIMATAKMIVEEAGGTIEGSIDVVARPAVVDKIILRESKLHEQSAGVIGLGYALDLFIRLGMQAESNGDSLSVTIPPYRVDLHEEIDLIEECLRFFGYNSVPASLPRLTTGDVRHEPLAELEETMRDLFVRFGLAEAITYSFISAEHNAIFSEEKPVNLDNALTENIASMRLSFLPGLLHTVSFNRSYGTRDGAVYEVGRTYHSAEGGVAEKRGAAFALFGHRPSSWGETKRAYDYFDAKGLVEAVASQLRVELRVHAAERPGFRKGQTAVLRSGDREVAVIGALTAEALHAFDIKGDVVAGSFDLEALLASMHEWKMKPVSRFPGVPMVIGMFHKPDLTFENIVETVRGLNAPYLQDVGLWDRFVPKDHDGDVKTAIGLWYQAQDRSLTQEEIAEVHHNVTRRISELLPVRLITT